MAAPASTSLNQYLEKNPDALARFDHDMPLTDPSNLVAMGVLMTEAYKTPPADMMPNVYGEGGLSKRYNLPDGSKVEYFDYKGSSQAYITADPKGNIFVTFRGTQEAVDYVKDLNPKVVETAHGDVRKGFHDALHEHDNEGHVLYDDMKNRIEALKKEMPPGVQPHLYVSGHSLGGAVAEVFTREMTESGQKIDGLVTIGEPATGDKKYAERNNQLFGDRTVRIAALNDLVPEAGAATHSTRGFYLDKNNNFRSDLTAGEWGARFDDSYFQDTLKERFGAHDKFNSYTQGFIKLDEENRAFNEKYGAEIIDHFKKDGFPVKTLKEADMHDVPHNPTAAQLCRLLHDHKDELLHSDKISEQQYANTTQALKAYTMEHPDQHVNDPPAKTPSPHSRSSMREEYAKEHPYSPQGVAEKLESLEPVFGKGAVFAAKTLARVAADTLSDLGSDAMMDYNHFIKPLLTVTEEEKHNFEKIREEVAHLRGLKDKPAHPGDHVVAAPAKPGEHHAALAQVRQAQADMDGQDHSSVTYNISTHHAAKDTRSV